MTEYLNLVINKANTHSAFVVIQQQDGTAANVFIDGVPDSCDHDFTGSPVYFNKKGEMFDWKTIPEYRHMTDEMRSEMYRLRCEEGDERFNFIMGSVTCRKCGKPEMAPWI